MKIISVIDGREDLLVLTKLIDILHKNGDRDKVQVFFTSPNDHDWELIIGQNIDAIIFLKKTCVAKDIMQY